MMAGTGIFSFESMKNDGLQSFVLEGDNGFALIVGIASVPT
jgi:hypothetical protein